PFLLIVPQPPRFTLFPYTTLFRSGHSVAYRVGENCSAARDRVANERRAQRTISHANVDRVCGFASRANGFSNGVVGLPRHFAARSEEHTSELQSQSNLVCRLLLEK